MRAYFKTSGNLSHSATPYFILSTVSMSFLLYLAFKYDLPEKSMLLRISVIIPIAVLLYGLVQFLIAKNVGDSFIKVAMVGFFSAISIMILTIVISSFKLDYVNFVNIMRSIGMLFAGIIILAMLGYFLITTYKVSKPIIEQVVYNRLIASEKAKTNFQITDMRNRQALEQIMLEFNKGQEKLKQDSAKFEREKVVRQQDDLRFEQKEKQEKKIDPIERLSILLDNWLIKNRLGFICEQFFQAILQETKMSFQELKTVLESQHFRKYKIKIGDKEVILYSWKEADEVKKEYDQWANA